MENYVNHRFGCKITTKLICLFLTLLIIFFAVPSIVYAETAEALGSLGREEESAALSDGETYKYEPDVYEVESLREENVKHFRLSDGSYVAAVYPTAVHMPDGEGGWTDIDNSLAPLLSNLTTFDGRIKFSKKINGNGSLFTLHNGSTKISLALTGANKGTVGEVTNNTDAEDETTLQKMMNLEKLSSSVIYRDILSGTDLEYKINGNSIKENIIIRKKEIATPIPLSLV